MSLLMLIFSVSPILAPLTGSLVIELASWRGVFWVVTGAAVLGLIMVSTVLKETRPAHLRLNSTVGSALTGYATLLRDRHFLGVVFIGSFGVSSFFAYLANSSFVLINHYGLTPTQYSLAFSVNAVSFIGASQFTGRLGSRYGLKRVVKTAVVGYAATMVLLAAITAAGVDKLAVLMVMLVIGYGFLGLVIPSSAVIALEEHGAIAGTASALMGTLQFGTGALVIALLGRFIDGTSLPMVAGIAACAVISFTFARVTLRYRMVVPAA
jgi:DHA1 family bicyclomycin/chloramphenicol resistance-like MFS transporter